ncbi:acyltransferase [Dactylosporangium salmoneum]|uniref:Acyltransferase n=1 Tax=Dactylosporangium salmoneum TaxID=53361 RepID=A0ABP5UKR0_9ACTN
MVTLRDRYDPAANGLGLLRQALALAVLVAHAWPLGLGRPSPLHGLSGGQADLGGLAVDGFFALSGFLVAASARRGGPLRFAWRRFLRIYPGLWVCLLGTALVAAAAGHGGALGYVRGNWTGTTHQWDLDALFRDTPYGRLVGSGVVNGSLWSLTYELLCYAGLALLVAAGLPRRAPWLVPALAVAAFAAAATHPRGGLALPAFGYVDAQLACDLGLLFLLGASAQLYAHRVPLHPLGAVAAGLLLAGSLLGGGYFPVGCTALAYLLLYAACAVPPRLHRVGREHDYSYGIYIYAFPIQQLVADLGGAAWGVAPYVALCVAPVLLLAAASWHLVERPALTLKDRRALALAR